MIAKKTEKHLRKVQSELSKALDTNRLKAWERLALTGIKTKVDDWIESYIDIVRKEKKVEDFDKRMSKS